MAPPLEAQQQQDEDEDEPHFSTANTAKNDDDDFVDAMENGFFAPEEHLTEDPPSHSNQSLQQENVSEENQHNHQHNLRLTVCRLMCCTSLLMLYIVVCAGLAMAVFEPTELESGWKSGDKKEEILFWCAVVICSSFFWCYLARQITLNAVHE